jgi:type VI protein secretion system component Hcp
MAIDAYLQIDGIKGESQDSVHQGWIELTSAQWGVLQPRSATHQPLAATRPNAASTRTLH